MKNILYAINRITTLIISILITSTLTANNEQSIKTKSATNLNNSINCIVECFKVIESSQYVSEDICVG